jgi:hypothetical protein
MSNESGWYICGKGDAGWMGVIDGPFATEESAVAKAKKWKAPKWDDDQLEVLYSENGDPFENS